MHYMKCFEEASFVNASMLSLTPLRSGKEAFSKYWNNVLNFIHKILTFYPLNLNPLSDI